jgi:hypothetical protein
MSDYTSRSGGYVYTESSSLTQELEYHMINTAEPKSKWSIGPEFDITFFTPSPMPNWFHRTMQRLILGIYWKKADE